MAVAQVAGMRPAAVALMVVLSAADIVGRPHGASRLSSPAHAPRSAGSATAILMRAQASLDPMRRAQASAQAASDTASQAVSRATAAADSAAEAGARSAESDSAWSDAELPASVRAAAGCAASDSAAMLVDPPCPAEVSADQVCPFEQVRLTPGLWDAGSLQWFMSVSFASTNDTMAGAQPVVRMARQEAPLVDSTEDGCVMLFTGSSTSYRYVSNGGPYFDKRTQFYSSPLIHHVDVGPLLPSTSYFYQVGREATEDAPALFRGTVFRFRTPPAPGAAPAPSGLDWQEGSTRTGESMTLVMIGDIGQTFNSNQTACTVKDRWMSDPSVAGAVIIGDMAYADGDGNRWDTWGRLMEQAFAQLPVLVLPGNHEIEMDAETYMPFAAYRHRFRMPSKLPETIGPVLGGDFLYEGGSSYYSLSVGLVHMVMLNNYNTHSALLNVDTDPQRLFLEKTLSGVDRAVTPFVIVCMHNPMYNSNLGHHHESFTTILRKWAEPLFIKYGVDAVFSGHVHAYERNGGVEFGRASATGPVYITIGDGGNHEGLYNEWLPKPDYSVFRDGRYYGHGELTVYNRSHMKWSWIPNAEQGPSLPIDETWIRPRSEKTNLLAQKPAVQGAAHDVVRGKGEVLETNGLISRARMMAVVGGVGLLSVGAVVLRRMSGGGYRPLTEPLLP